MAAHPECLLGSRRHSRQYGAEIEWPAVRHASLDARLERGGKRRIEGAETLTYHGNIAAIDVGTSLQHIDDGTDHLAPLGGNGELEGGLSLAGTIERKRCQPSPHKGIAPSMQLLLAGVEPRQNDSHRRPLCTQG